MLKGFTHARLACGCRLTFREGVEGSPVTVVIAEKAPGCVLSLHVRDLPIYDYREAMRAPTRSLPLEEEEYKKKRAEAFQGPSWTLFLDSSPLPLSLSLIPSRLVVTLSES